MTAQTPVGDLDGRSGWVAVAATFVSVFTCFGVVYSFGTFFSAMSADLGAGKGATALIFGLTIFFLFGLGVVTGRLADRHGPRPVVLAGAASMGIGLLATSFVTRTYLGYATYGVFVGTATACCYVPLVAQVSGWFVRRRAAALGIAVAGIGLGTLVGPPVANVLIEAIGWRSTYRVFAAVSVPLLVFAALLVRRAPAAAASAATLSFREVVANRLFRYLYVGGFFMGLALFVPFVFLVPYAKDQGIGAGAASALVSLLGVGSLAGRLVLGTLGSRLGVVRLYQLCFATMSASFVLWLVSGASYPVLVAFALTLGISYGGYVALSPAVAAELFGLVGLGSILGALYTSGGFGALIGPYLGGRILDVTNDSYPVAIVVAMVLNVVGTLLLLPLRGQRGPVSRSS